MNGCVQPLRKDSKIVGNIYSFVEAMDANVESAIKALWEDARGEGVDHSAVLAQFQEYVNGRKLNKLSYVSFEIANMLLEELTASGEASVANAQFEWFIGEGYGCEVFDREGNTLFHKSVMYGNLRAAKTVCRHWSIELTRKRAQQQGTGGGMVDFDGASVNRITGNNALHMLASSSMPLCSGDHDQNVLEIAKWLVEDGSCQVYLRNKEGNFPLHCACMSGKHRLALWLGERNKDSILEKNNNGNNAIMLAQGKHAGFPHAELLRLKSLTLVSSSERKEKRLMRSEQDYEYLYKIILVGSAAVGKTCLLARYTTDESPGKHPPTVGVEIAVKMARLKNGETVKAQLWDTAGQERYNAVTKTHYRRAHAAILMYDVTSRESYKNLDQWIKNLRQYGRPDMVIWVVGNKEDLRKKVQELGLLGDGVEIVQIHEGVRFAQKHNLCTSRGNDWMHTTTSAKHGLNVNELFQNVYDEIFERFGNTLAKKLEWEPKDAVTFDIPKPLPEKESSGKMGCC
jgi:Rab family protein